jgi:chemotaxis protein MotB
MKSAEFDLVLLKHDDGHAGLDRVAHAPKGGHDHDDEHEGHPHEEGEPWLMSFADLILNLLLFFIVLYSISTIDEKKLKQLAQQINGETVPQTVVKKAQSDEENAVILQEIQTLVQKVNQDIASDSQKKETEKVKAKISELFKLPPGKDKENDLFEVVLSGRKYFIIGKPELTEASKSAIRAFAVRLKPIAGDIGLYIEGHASPDEIISGMPSGFEWQLASQRAANVLLELKKNGLIVKNVSTAGFGSQIAMTDLSPTEASANAEGDRHPNKNVENVSRARVHLRVVREVKSP